jgi:hypothetical protein
MNKYTKSTKETMVDHIDFLNKAETAILNHVGNFPTPKDTTVYCVSTIYSSGRYSGVFTYDKTVFGIEQTKVYKEIKFTKIGDKYNVQQRIN